MHEIAIYGHEQHTFQFPSAWDEVTGEQLPMLATTLLSDLPPTAQRFLLLQHLADLPDAIAAQLKDAEALIFDRTDEHGAVQHALLPQLDWAFAPPCYTKSHVSTVLVADLLWLGPEGTLDNYTLYRYIWCTVLANQYLETKSVEHLDHFMGAAYLPPREAFNEEHIETRATALHSVPLETKLAALLNFRALAANLSKMYPLTFEVDPTKTSNGDPFDVVFDVCGPVFGPLRETEAENLHKVLRYVEYNLRKADNANPLALVDIPETADA